MENNTESNVVNIDTTTQQQCGQPQQQSPKKKSRKTFVTLSILAVVLILLVATCPGKEKHWDAVSDELREVVDDSAKQFGGGLMGMFSATFSYGVINMMVKNLVDVESYGICSVGRVRHDGKTETVSVGILGHIFTFDADDVKKKMDEGLNGDADQSDADQPDDQSQDGVESNMNEI